MDTSKGYKNQNVKNISENQEILINKSIYFMLLITIKYLKIKANSNFS